MSENNLVGQVGEVRFALEIKRASGAIEKVELVGSTTLTEQQLREALADGSDTLNSGTQRGD
jgi:hypothetical protein